MRLNWTRFGGICPKISPRNLSDVNSQISQNTFLAEYDLQPIKEPLVVQALPDSLQRSIYLWRRGGSSEWLYWTGDVDVVEGPIADDQYDRIYYTDGTTLHMKLWDGGKVEVADVSKAAPTTVGITKLEIYHYSRTELKFKVNGVDFAVNPTGMSLKGSSMEITYHIAPSVVQTNAIYWLYMYTGNSTINVGNSTSQQALFDAETTITSDDAGIFLPVTLKLKVISVEEKQTADFVDLASNPPRRVYGMDVVVVCNLDSGHSEQTVCYAQTTVDSYGQESPPSTASAIVTWGVNDKLCLSGLSTGGRLYRSATGNTDSDFYYLTSPIGSYYTDSTPDAQLAEKMQIMENPPAAMSGLTSMAGGFLAAFNGKEVYFSEPWLPYSWPLKYRLTMDYDVVGLASMGSDLIVCTTGTPYYISGAHPDIMTVNKMSVEQSCVSKRSICFAQNFVIYASPDGLMSITGGSSKIITSGLYTREQWQALTPSQMIGCVHDNRFIGWHPTGAIIIDFDERQSMLSTTDQTAVGRYDDLVNDQLYLIQGSNITSWREGANYLTATWRSKKYQNVQDVIFNTAKVLADSYTNLTFKIYANDVQVYSYAVPSGEAFRVPKLDRDVLWSIEIVTTNKVFEVIVASSMILMRTLNGVRDP